MLRTSSAFFWRLEITVTFVKVLHDQVLLARRFLSLLGRHGHMWWLRLAVISTAAVSHGWWAGPEGPPEVEPLEEQAGWRQHLREWLPGAERRLNATEEWLASLASWGRELEGASTWGSWDVALWMVVDTLFGMIGWALFGSAWTKVRTGCRRLLQVLLVVLGLCLVAHYVWAVCYPIVSLLIGACMAMAWLLRKVLRGVGAFAFWFQRVTGGSPEASEAEFLGPATGRTPETSQLRAFKRSGEQPKYMVVKRGEDAAVFAIGMDSQSIKTHGLYVPVECNTIRGSPALVRRLRDVEKVHLCRNEACTEEGGEHFVMYGLVRKNDPERFQMAQAREGARKVTHDFWAWLKGSPLTEGISQLMHRLRELGSESEQEEEHLVCCGSLVTWRGPDGTMQCLANRPCSVRAQHFGQLLQDDVPTQCGAVALRGDHATQYLTRRYPDKCSVTFCRRFGNKLQHGVVWCSEHEPSSLTPTRPSSTSARRSRSRSRTRVAEDIDEEENDDEENGVNNEEAHGDEDRHGRARKLLGRARECEEPESKERTPRRRGTTRSPGHTPKGSSISRNLSRMGMLESPGSEGAGSLLEEFFEIFAAGKADGLREDQARKKLGADRLLLPGDLLRQLVGEAENEQAQGQRGLSRFLTTWRKELARLGRPHGEGEGCSDWSMVEGGSQAASPVDTPEKDGDRATSLPLASSLRTSASRTRPTSEPAPPPGLAERGQQMPQVEEKRGDGLRVAPPGIYRPDTRAGARTDSGPTAEPVVQIAKAIQHQTAELASLVRQQTEGAGGQVPGTIRGLNKQSEELVFLLRACGQYQVRVGAEEHGQALANSLLSAQVGASTKLRAAGFRQRMSTRLAVGIAGPYWGIQEKYGLSAADFLSYTDAELDQFASEAKVMKNTDQRPPPPSRFDEWTARVRRQTDVWCLVYGEEWRAVRNNALNLLSEWHLSHPHRWPLAIVIDIWEEIHWRFLEELKDVLRSLKKEIGRETISLTELKFHALLPGPDGQAWLVMPTTFDIEKPDSWFQTEVLPRIERKQDRLLWNLTWQGGARKDRNPAAPAGGAGESAGSLSSQSKPTLKSLWGPKLTPEEVGMAKDRAPLDRHGKLLCWGNLCHIGCQTTGCQRSHEGLRGSFENLDPCVQMQLLKRGGLNRTP